MATVDKSKSVKTLLDTKVLKSRRVSKTKIKVLTINNLDVE